jgi:peptide/nickel transport system permease protein
VIGYVAKRMTQVVPLLLIMSAVVFLVMRSAPGDPVLAMYGGQPGVTPEVEQAARERLGLDQPLPVQYWHWLSGVATGDLGESYVNHSSVSGLLAQKLPASLELAIFALLITVVVSVPLGVIAAVRRGRPLDRAISWFAASGIAIPGYWLGIMFILVFAVWLDWLPSTGYVAFTDSPLESLRYAVLPALTLAVGLTAPVTRFVRSSMLDVLEEPYIRTARAMGVPERRVVYRHALRNAILPAITVIGLQFGTLMGGAIVIEWVFAWPGIGQLLVNSITGRDYAVVQGTILLTILLFAVANAIVDVTYISIDPRLRRQ